jgi:hypothetical protein
LQYNIKKEEGESEDLVQAVKDQPSKHKALSSNPSTKGRKKKSHKGFISNSHVTLFATKGYYL